MSTAHISMSQTVQKSHLSLWWLFPSPVLPVGTWYAAVPFTIQKDSNVSPILLSTPMMCLQGLFETFQNACHVPGGDATIREWFWYKYHSSARTQMLAFFQSLLMEGSRGSGGGRTWEKGTGGHAFRLFYTLIRRESSLERLLGRTAHLPCIYIIQKAYWSAQNTLLCLRACSIVWWGWDSDAQQSCFDGKQRFLLSSKAHTHTNLLRQSLPVYMLLSIFTELCKNRVSYLW